MAERVTVGGQAGRVMIALEQAEEGVAYTALIDGGKAVPVLAGLNAYPLGTLSETTVTVEVLKDGQALVIAAGLNPSGKVDVPDVLEMRKFDDALNKEAYLAEVAKAQPDEEARAQYLDKERVLLLRTQIRSLQSRKIILQKAAAAIDAELESVQAVLAAVPVAVKAVTPGS